MRSRSAAIVDYQQRAREFAPGDKVSLFMTGQMGVVGRVVAVYPAIGMVDVEWPTGNQRMPVEDLQKYTGKEYDPPTAEHANVPGGTSVAPVAGGPEHLPVRTKLAMTWVKRALYWAAKDRKYRASSGELESGSYMCPKCKESALRKAVYHRAEGQSEHLLGCPACLFLIKREAILGSEEYEAAQDPLNKLRVNAMAKDDIQPGVKVEWQGEGSNQKYRGVVKQVLRRNVEAAVTDLFWGGEWFARKPSQGEKTVSVKPGELKKL